MTLLLIRKNFVAFTGRFDLVTDDESWRDKGANFYIQTGQKWLDRQAEVSFGEGKTYLDLPANEWFALLNNCRSVRDVYISNANGERWPLKRKDYPEITRMRVHDPAGLQSGSPKYYSLGNINTHPETLGTTTIARFGPNITYTEAGNPWGFNSIIVAPKSSEALLLEIHGLFYQPELVADGDRNVWSEEYPFILLLAACRQLEISYRNTSGANDWENAINAELLTLGFDLVDQISNDITQIRG
jgi:hypothetical protein